MTHTPPLLETLRSIATKAGLDCTVGAWTDSPHPGTYLVATPIADVLDVFADNSPGVTVEHVRVSVFTTGNYLPLRDQLTALFLEAGITIEARSYITFEADTGYHHYVFDLATYSELREHNDVIATGLVQD